MADRDRSERPPGVAPGQPISLVVPTAEHASYDDCPVCRELRAAGVAIVEDRDGERRYMPPPEIDQSIAVRLAGDRHTEPIIGPPTGVELPPRCRAADLVAFFRFLMPELDRAFPAGDLAVRINDRAPRPGQRLAPGDRVLLWSRSRPMLPGY